MSPIDRHDTPVIVRLIAATALTSGILYGYNLGVIAGAILFLVNAFDLSPALKEIAISASLFGAMLGAVAGGKLADWLGRRRSIIWAAALGAAAAIVGAASMDVWLLVSHRVVVGFSFGMLACVTPLYIAEISPDQKRGRLGALFSVALMVGILAAYLVDLSLSDVEDGWRFMFLIGMLPAIPLVALTLRLPESPSWLSHCADPDKPDTRSDIFVPSVRPLLVTSVALACIRQGTGVAISTFCAAELLGMAGFSSRATQLYGTVGVGVVYVVMTLAALGLIDRYGRRPLMIGGLIGMAVGFGLVGYVLQLPSISNEAGIIATVGLFLFAGSFALGPGAIVFLLISELLPQSVRGAGMGIASLFLWVSYLLSTLTFPILIGAFGKSPVFLGYAFLAALSAVFVYVAVPETKGRRLVDIQNAVKPDGAT